MASNSPGGDKDKYPEKEKSNLDRSTQSDPPGRTRASARSSLSDKVGFFEQVFKSRQRSRSLGKEHRQQQAWSAGSSSGHGHNRTSRVEVGYHGPRTDARDRSSEDPRHHRIPRASLSPAGSPVTVPDYPGEDDEVLEQTRKKLRSRSASRGRDMERRSSRERSYERWGSKERSPSGYVSSKTLRDRLEEEKFQRQSDLSSGRIHDDIPASPYRSIQIKRTQSGRMIESYRGGASGSNGQYRSEFKPRALSFRVSPTKSDMDDVHQPLQPIFSRATPTRDTRTTPTRDQSMSITQHIQSKVSSSGSSTVYQKPPPLPERPPRSHQRHSEPLIYSSQEVRYF